MKIVDFHVHLLDEPGYLDGLLAALDACGIEMCCLSGLGPLFGCAGDAEVRAAFRAHPDRIIGTVYVRPGVDGPEKIDRAAGEGFRAIKVTLPRRPYDDPAYFPLWERADKHALPLLFHTGTVVTRQEAPGEGISSWNMHPMRIEPITREFPQLKVVIAHLGVHWNLDAGDVARLRPNAYVDLTGEPGGWRARADAAGMETWLWWPGAFRKVVFGTDVHYRKMKHILDEDRARLARLGVDDETQRLVFSGNARRLLGLEG